MNLQCTQVTEESNLYLHQYQKQQNVSHARTFLEHISDLDIDRDPAYVRQTNIVCSLGDLWNTREYITEMIKFGTNIIRMNLNLGSREVYANSVKVIRDVELSMNHNPAVGIAIDISAPPVRVGLMNNDIDGSIILKDGQFVQLSINESKKHMSSSECIWIDSQYFPSLLHCIAIGDRVHFNDGVVSVIVRDIKYDCVDCLVEQGGAIDSYCRVQFPVERTYLKTYKTTYLSDLSFAAECKVDYVFTGYVSRPEHVREAKQILGDDIKLFAKIETKEAMMNIDQLVRLADGIIIGRDYLGLNFPIEKVFQLQKQLIAKCNILGKPVFVISQLLESMRFKPRATRAEISDVANAVLDGADGLILTVETSLGIYPKESLIMLHKTCREAESAVFHEKFWFDLKLSRDIRGLSPLTPAYLSAMAAVEAASQCHASVIFVITTSGNSALTIASFRPFCPVVAIMRRPQVARYCHSIRGIHPFVFTGNKLDEWAHDMDYRLNAAISFARSRGFVANGDKVVFLTGFEAGSGSTNTVRVVELPSEDTNLCIVRSETDIHGIEWDD